MAAMSKRSHPLIAALRTFVRRVKLPSARQLFLRAVLLLAALLPLLLVIFPAIVLPDWAQENILLLCLGWIVSLGAICFLAQPKRRPKWKRTRRVNSTPFSDASGPGSKPKLGR